MQETQETQVQVCWIKQINQLTHLNVPSGISVWELYKLMRQNIHSCQSRSTPGQSLSTKLNFIKLACGTWFFQHNKKMCCDSRIYRVTLLSFHFLFACEILKLWKLRKVRFEGAEIFLLSIFFFSLENCYMMMCGKKKTIQ